MAVELTLDCADSALYAKDHYVSVRVGDVQKLAKLAPSRTYKLPAAAVAARKYGRVEIFRRVGQTIVCVDPEVATSSNEVEVVLDGNSDTKISFQAGVCETGAAKTAPKPKQVAPPSPSSAGQKAAAYLEHHHLELRLQDAMQAVLRERPADPAAFLANVLMNNGSLVSKLPKVPEAPEPQSQSESPKQLDPAPPVAPPPPPRIAEEQGEKAAKSAPPSAPEPSKPRPVDVKPVASYFGAHFQESLGEKPSLFAKFPAAPRPPPMLADSDLSQAFLPSSGSYGGCAAKFGGIIRFAPQGVPKAAVGPSASAPAVPQADLAATPSPSFSHAPLSIEPAPGFMMSNITAMGSTFWDTGMAVGLTFY